MKSTTNDCVSASMVLKRLLGERSEDFKFAQIPAENDRDVFEVEARGGRVYVSGSSPVAMTRGGYEYLRRACDCHVSWESSHLELPSPLPSLGKMRVVCPHQYREYMNVCTLCYSMIWWDWPRWEREIDWMALHGINMPTLLLGQSAIWQRVWRSFGLTDEHLSEYFNGPAFLAWQWMGNLCAHAAPLPQHWMDRSLDLQKRIMRRVLELGMAPITPGFAGFVPPAFTKIYPQAKLLGSATESYKSEPSLVLDPRDPMFTEIGGKFIREYVKEYGTGHLYLADTFNEIMPPFEGPTKNDELAAVCEAVWRGIKAGDPQGKYVLQTWTFGYHGAYWPAETVGAYVSRVPVDDLIFLDLCCDARGRWETNEYLRRRQWIFCILHNFGQSTPMFGDLERYSAGMAKAVNDPDHGLLVGAGMTPEGIEQNSAVYEMLTDMMWRTEPLDLVQWTDEYCRCRYGGCPQAMSEAWEILRHTVYRQLKSPVPIYVKRPHLKVRGGYKGMMQVHQTAGPPGDREAAGDYKGVIPYNPAELPRAIELFLACADELGQSDLYQRDLVDVLKQHLANVADQIFQSILAAYQRTDEKQFGELTERFLDLLEDLDRLLSTRPEYHLWRWIASARNCAVEDWEADHYEYNARLQVTRWGGPRSLTVYAHKEWAGLIRDYYVPRWKLFSEELARSLHDASFDEDRWHQFMDQWELDFACKKDTSEEKPATDIVELARELLAKYRYKLQT